MILGCCFDNVFVLSQNKPFSDISIFNDRAIIKDVTSKFLKVRILVTI